MELVRCYIWKFSSYLNQHVYSLLKNLTSSSVVLVWKSCILQKLLKNLHRPQISLPTRLVLAILWNPPLCPLWDCRCLKVALSFGSDFTYQQNSGILIHDKGFCKLTVQRNTSTLLDLLSWHNKFDWSWLAWEKA